MVVLGRFGFECVDGVCDGSTMSLAERRRAETGSFRMDIAVQGSPLGTHIALFSSRGTVDRPSWKELYNSARFTDCGSKLRSSIASVNMSATPRIDQWHDQVLDTEPSFMYLVAVHCEQHYPVFQGFQGLSYRVEFLNPGGWWGRHFSYEDQGMLQMHILFCICTLGLALQATSTLLQLMSAQLSHPPLVALTLPMWGVALSHFLAAIFYADYASHGFGPEMALFGCGGTALASRARASLPSRRCAPLFPSSSRPGSRCSTPPPT